MCCARVLSFFFPLHCFMVSKQQRLQQRALRQTPAGLCVFNVFFFFKPTPPSKQKHAAPKCFFSHFQHGSRCTERSRSSPGHSSWAGLDTERSRKPVAASCPNMDELQIPQERGPLFLGLTFFLCVVVVLREKKKKKKKKVTHQVIDV